MVVNRLDNCVACDQPLQAEIGFSRVHGKCRDRFDACLNSGEYNQAEVSRLKKSELLSVRRRVFLAKQSAFKGDTDEARKQIKLGVRRLDQRDDRQQFRTRKLIDTCWKCGDLRPIVMDAITFPEVRWCFECWGDLPTPQVIIGAVRDGRYRSPWTPAEISLTAIQWIECLQSSKGYCAYCRVQVGVKHLTMEHIVPMSKGGLHCLNNCVPVCRNCNNRKTRLALDYFLAKLNLPMSLAACKPIH
jgi:hypothetical protein